MIRVLLMSLSIIVFEINCSHSFYRSNFEPRVYQHRKIRFDKDKYLHIFSINQDKALISIAAGRTVEKRELRSPGLFLEDYFEASGADLIVSGGYMLSFSPPTPLGYVRIKGREMSRRHVSWLMAGFFCTNGKKSIILEGNSRNPDKEAGDCIQAGPMIINGSKNRYEGTRSIGDGEMKLVESEQAHIFVCTKDDLTFKIGFSDKVRMDRLSAILSRKKLCDNALRLTGHTTGGILLSERLYGYDEVPITNVIQVKLESD